MNIYVGNLSQKVTEDDLREAFESFGQVTSIKIIKDRFTNESKGFGFIEMPVKQEATTAMEDLNGKDIKGKTISVNEAKPRTDDHRGGGGGGGRQRRSW
jgi:RNA recognition motif-containing protein